MPRPRSGVEMILEVWIHGEYRSVETWPEIAVLIDEIVNNLAVENPDSAWVDPGEHAQLVIARERRPDEPWPVADYVWVTDNPAPPDFDPRVVSDPGVPYFYHPRSTLPAALIRAALEEFCRTGTGDRPECVD